MIIFLYFFWLEIKKNCVIGVIGVFFLTMFSLTSSEINECFLLLLLFGKVSHYNFLWTKCFPICKYVRYVWFWCWGKEKILLITKVIQLFLRKFSWKNYPLLEQEKFQENDRSSTHFFLSPLTLEALKQGLMVDWCLFWVFLAFKSDYRVQFGHCWAHLIFESEIEMHQ